jgi:predicted ribosomally synthesized peptide with nif11-like leader
MSTDAVKKFFQLAQQDAELLDRIKSAVAERGEESSFELVELASGYGCEFTATELVEYFATGNGGLELSEAELEAVSGGILDIRGTLGRMASILKPSLMTKRETEPPEK